ncbi:hypothetical protein RMATCC62417_18337 [Rhizopus microsporus]|nr:hypothetical protein RMATCC62417_18337 [Rhizopus microsporus]
MDKRLPFEILIDIVSHLKDEQYSLGQLISTSKTMHKAALPMLYRSPHFEKMDSFKSFVANLTPEVGSFVYELDLHMLVHRWKSITAVLLTQLTCKTRNLQVLNLDFCVELSNNALREIIKPLGDLRILGLDDCLLLGDVAVEAIVNSCPFIVELGLSSTHIRDKSLFLIAKHLVHLERVYLSSCDHITEVGIKALLDGCKKLKHFDVRDCYNIVGEFHQPVDSDSDEYIDEDDSEEETI